MNRPAPGYWPFSIKTLLPALRVGTLALLAIAVSAQAQQQDTYDYWQHQREMIRRGQQAVFMCNGLFTSGRSLEEVYARELAFLPDPIGTPEGGDYNVDWELRAVEIGSAMPPGGGHWQCHPCLDGTRSV